MPRAVDLLARGAVDPAGVVTGRFALEELQQCFQWFAGAKDRQVKMLIDPWA
jgi:threonine dehydrogenase-like Zn-dependent dehydrogenase